MADYKVKMVKVVGALPATLTPNTFYAVRVGTGYDLYLSDATGQVAYKLNHDTTPEASLPYLVVNADNSPAVVTSLAPRNTLLGADISSDNNDNVAMGQGISFEPGILTIVNNSDGSTNSFETVGASSIAIGNQTTSQGIFNVALGYSSTVEQSSSVAIGAFSKASRAGEVSIGDANYTGWLYGARERFLANVKAGELDTDAVNLQQLNDATSTGGVADYIQGGIGSKKYQLKEFQITVPSSGSSTNSLAHPYGSKIMNIQGYVIGTNGRKYFINDPSYDGYTSVQVDDTNVYVSTNWSRSRSVFNRTLNLVLWVEID